MTSVLPPIQDHTIAKHHILRHHLSAWFPILGSSHLELQYIDGFAGPGEYEGGDLGSPVIALNTIRAHKKYDSFTQSGGKVKFLFVEENAAFFNHLKDKIERRRWPTTFRINIQHSKFEDALERYLDSLALIQAPMPPTLLFVDPFGPSGFPLELLKRVASYSRIDVLINLNCNEFLRWLPDRAKHDTANKLFGSDRWRKVLLLSGRERTDFLASEYESALREIGWGGTSFEMVNSQNQIAYHLVFGTEHPKGMEVIKTAMRSASQTGEFRYTDRIDPAQPILMGLQLENDFPRQIGEHLFQKYEGQEIAYRALLEEEIDWHRLWLPTDLKKGLQYLEDGDEPRIVGVKKENGRTRRTGTYPDDCLITFGRPPQNLEAVQGQLL